MSSPIVSSLLAEIAATCLIFSESSPTVCACVLRFSTAAATALSIPRLRSSGFAPAATFLRPSFTIACASTVAVVVPSPARSLVFEATCLSICAPMFSRRSSSSISLATVTPSLVICGPPKDLSITTLRPFGPRVTFTVLASLSTPRRSPSRASRLNLISFAIVFSFF